MSKSIGKELNLAEIRPKKPKGFFFKQFLHANWLTTFTTRAYVVIEAHSLDCSEFTWRDTQKAAGFQQICPALGGDKLELSSGYFMLWRDKIQFHVYARKELYYGELTLEERTNQF